MNKKIKLYRLLNILTKEELKQLRKAVESPLYAVSQSTQNLYKILVRKHPDFDSSNEEKERIFTKIYPKKTYDDLKLRRVFSELTQLVLKFLAFNRLQNSTWQREQTLAKIYEDMKLPGLSKDMRQGLLQVMNRDFVKNENYWKKKMILQGKEQFSVPENDKATAVKFAEATVYAADRYFAYATVRHALLIKNKALIFNISYKLPYLEAVKDAYNNGLLRDNGLFRLYILALQLTETPRDDVFFAYQSLFFEQGNIGYGEDGLFLFYVGLNYAARQNNSGNLEFKNLPLKWYKFGLKGEILFIDGLIKQVDFSNIVIFGCQNNEIDWAHEFIEEYVNRLPKEIQEEELLYSKAWIYFQEKKFDKVIDNIFEFSFSPTYILKAKVLLLKSQFEIYLMDSSYYQILNSSIRAFESYLYRDKNRTEENKLALINFCKILKKIIQLKMKSIEIDKIKEWGEKELKERNIVVSKSWLLEKIKGN